MDPALSSLKRSGQWHQGANTGVHPVKLLVIDQAEKDQNKRGPAEIANLGSPYVDVTSVVPALSFILSVQLWQARWSASRISASP
jgi:hypothetical protein